MAKVVEETDSAGDDVEVEGEPTSQQNLLVMYRICFNQWVVDPPCAKVTSHNPPCSNILKLKEASKYILHLAAEARTVCYHIILYLLISVFYILPLLSR